VQGLSGGALGREEVPQATWSSDESMEPGTLPEESPGSLGKWRTSAGSGMPGRTTRGSFIRTCQRKI